MRINDELVYLDNVHAFSSHFVTLSNFTNHMFRLSSTHCLPIYDDQVNNTILFLLLFFNSHEKIKNSSVAKYFTKKNPKFMFWGFFLVKYLATLEFFMFSWELKKRRNKIFLYFLVNKTSIHFTFTSILDAQSIFTVKKK